MSHDITEAGREILAQQPFSVDLGAELVHLEPGQAELRLPLETRHLQQHGFVHGGVIAALADLGLA